MTIELLQEYDLFNPSNQTIRINAVDPQIGRIYTLELFGETVSFEATAATDANVAAGLKAAIDASTAAAWDNVTTSLTDGGDTLLLVYSPGGGTIRSWRGDAPTVAQVTEIRPANVTAGDTFRLTVNGKQIQVVASSSDLLTVVSGLASALVSSDVPEFGSFDVARSADGTYLILTASEPGVPFAIEATAVAGTGLVTVEQTVSPNVGSKSVQVVVIGDTVTTFKGYYNNAETAPLTTASATTAAIAAALNGLTGISNAAVTADVVESSFRRLTIEYDHNGDDTDLRIVLGNTGDAGYALAVTSEVVGSATVQTIALPSTADESCLFRLNLDGYWTATIDGSLSDSDLWGAVQSAIRALPQFTGVLVQNAVSVTGTSRTAVVTFANQTDVDTMEIEWVSPPNDIDIDPVSRTVGVAISNAKFWVAIDADAGTFTLTANGETTTALDFDSTTGEIETALEALAGVDDVVVTTEDNAYLIEFAGSLATDPVTLTANGGGLTGAGTQAMTITNVIASRGPNHWDTPQNWEPSGVPVSGDTVYFESGSVDCLYGLDQSAVVLASLQISAAYTGQIGLSRFDGNGSLQYRLQELTIGATTILIGYGDGSGSSKIQINTSDVATSIQVRATGGSSEAGVPAVVWRGSHPANYVEVLGGEFGTALYARQSATINKLSQRGGSVSLNNTSLSEIDAAGQTIAAQNCRMGSLPITL